MITDTAAKRDTQKLQRAIVDGLEDVKAQDIQVFDTEHLSALFERVIIASGTSNRQTKALAASVRDAVREAGFPKPRIEGESNGEWIIVDCAQAVVHIMQPSFRTYYHLEELWGEKPVRLKFGAVKPAVKAPAPVKAAPAKRAAAGKKGAAKAAPAKPVKKTRPLAPPAPVSASVEKKSTRPATRSAAPAAANRGAAAPAAAKKAPARKSAAARAPAPRTAAAKAPAKTAGRKPAAPKKA
jgi:ribosome-associated protein